jgi:hypothetical protein
MSSPKNVVNLCTFGHPDARVPGVFDDTVHSVAHLVRLCGAVPVISRNTIDPTALNILWGAGAHHSPSFEAMLKHCNAGNTIVFNMEQLDSDSPLVGPEYLQFLSHFRVLDYSIHNVKALRKTYPLIRAEEFPLLPAPHFSCDFDGRQSEHQYHFAFYGAMNPRRQSVLEQMQSAGIKIKFIGGKYGKSLADELLGCQAVLNIHAYETSVFETARVLRPIAMGIPVLSESSKLPQLIDWEHASIQFADYNAIAAAGIEAARTGFAQFLQTQSTEPDFLYRYYSNPALLKSVRHLLGLE